MCAVKFSCVHRDVMYAATSIRERDKKKKIQKRELVVAVVLRGRAKNVSREIFDSALAVHYLNELLSSALTQALFGLK